MTVVPFKTTPMPDNAELTDCSFVKPRLSPRKRRAGYNFWAVTPSGDYAADCKTGNKLAMEYLQFIRRRPLPLNWIVADMPRGDEACGLQVGFLGSVGRAAELGSWHAGSRLSEIVRPREWQA